MESHQKIKGYACAIAAIGIWSGFILASRQGGISALTAYDVIAIRYSTCALILLPVWCIYRITIRTTSSTETNTNANTKNRIKLLQPKLIISSLVGALLYSLCAFTGFETTPATHSALLLPGSIPIIVTLLSIPLLRSHQSNYRWFGLSLITIGICTLLGGELINKPSQSLNTGHLWIIASAFCWSLYSVLIQKWHISPAAAIFSLCITTFCLYMPFYLFFLPKGITLPIHDEILPDVLLQSVYQGIMASIVQMFLYVRAVQFIGAQSMGVLMAAVPILSSIGAASLFSEPLTNTFLSALVCVCLGIVLTAINRPSFLFSRTTQPQNHPTGSSSCPS
jgi:drug/metabolite transporter (DMT)-like permease